MSTAACWCLNSLYTCKKTDASSVNEQQRLNPEHLYMYATQKHRHSHMVNTCNTILNNLKWHDWEKKINTKENMAINLMWLGAGALMEIQTQQVLYCHFYLFSASLNNSL